MKCAFCELPEIKERTIIRTEYAFAFPTNIPIVPGHVLVCPTKCIATLDDLRVDELLGLVDVVSKIKEALKKTFKTDGFNYAWNEGKIAGQSVPHLHLHVLPRKEGDTGITKYEPREFLYRPGSREESPEAELKEVAKKIMSELI